MHIKEIVLFIFLILGTLPGWAVKITGTEPSCAGLTIEFHTLTDPVSKSEKVVFILQPDAKGNFTVEVHVPEISWCFSDFGIYRIMLIVDPGKDIRIKLPTFRAKSFEESKNPYFEPVVMWVKTENASMNDLTNLTAEFDKRYFQLTNHYFDQLYYRQQKDFSDTIKRILGKEFANYNHSWFNMHKQVRFKELEAGTMRRGREKTAGSLNTIPPSFWKQPSFSDFLNNLFVNTLSIESKALAGSKIRQWISGENIAELLKWVQNYTGSTPPLSDLVLLKMLHDAYYSGEFQGTKILRLVRSDYFASNREPEIRTTAQKVNAKLSFLQPGTPAPEICLSDLSGKQVCSTDNTKPFQYLLFVDLEIPVCREHVKYLKTMAEKTGPGLLILLIVSDSKKAEVKEFISVNRIPGIVTTDTWNEAAKKYAIRSYPSAFLLDKEHKVVLAPARTPLDGFEFQFSQFKK